MICKKHKGYFFCAKWRYYILSFQFPDLPLMRDTRCHPWQATHHPLVPETVDCRAVKPYYKSNDIFPLRHVHCGREGKIELHFSISILGSVVSPIQWWYNIQCHTPLLAVKLYCFGRWRMGCELKGLGCLLADHNLKSFVQKRVKFLPFITRKSFSCTKFFTESLKPYHLKLRTKES